MKTVYLGAILVIVLFIISYTSQAHADYANPIKILDVQTQPDKVKIGDVFSINMTILNISPYPVFLTSGSCTPAFSVEFDSHAKQVYPNIACTMQAILQKIDPLGETTISNANKAGIIFQAVEAGTANANMTLPYFTKNQTSTDYSNIYYNASKSFQFQIYDANETSAPPNSMGTPNDRWVTPLQTTNSSGGKLNIHVEKGVDASGKIMPPPVTANMESPQQFQTPLKQFKSGVAANNVICNEGFQLILKREDGSPACVTPGTAQILVDRGWAKSITYDSGIFPLNADISNSNFTLNYNITEGNRILGIHITNNTNTVSLAISLDTSRNGSITLIVPQIMNDMIHNKGAQLVVLLDGHEVINYNETKDKIHSITIPIKKGTKQIIVASIVIM